jgi:hypothetical protein
MAEKALRELSGILKTFGLWRTLSARLAHFSFRYAMPGRNGWPQAMRLGRNMASHALLFISKGGKVSNLKY